MPCAQQHPDAKVVAHPECEAPVLDIADYIGSTHALLNYVVNDNAQKFIVVTESGILHEMQKRAPDKQLIPAPPEATAIATSARSCASTRQRRCTWRSRTLEPRLEMSESLRRAAELPLERMLAIG